MDEPISVVPAAKPWPRALVHKYGDVEQRSAMDGQIRATAFFQKPRGHGRWLESFDPTDGLVANCRIAFFSSGLLLGFMGFDFWE
ncbi:hypothetical protein NL676_001086 [Syzygium grande]|nr:hypothetical protein NL676_001086 [Syzygium grande]